jgi:chromosome segregation ATPase
MDMAEKNERLIDRDPDAEQEPEAVPFYKNETFILVLKISLALGVISSLLTGLIITNMRLSTLEDQYKTTIEEVTTLNKQTDIAIQNLKTLKSEYDRLAQQVGTLDLTTAKGELSQALIILDTQSAAIDKQLAVTRNGLMSLSRMVKGSRVWQEDYRNQYQELFDANKRIKDDIQKLRGIQEEEREEPQYIEMEF